MGSGFLVTQQSVEDLAAKIETLILNPELRIAMGKNGRKRFEEHFTLTIFENKLHNILSKYL